MDAHEEGLRVARRVAQWHIGDQSWADTIVYAYNHPGSTEAALEAEIAEGDH